MKEKKTLSPTPDQVAQALGGVEEVTLNEEFERKRRGLTQEPKVKRIKREPVPEPEIQAEKDVGLKERIKRAISREVAQIKAGKSGRGAESSGKESLGDEVSDWLWEHEEDYEFKHFDAEETAVEYEAGAPRLPLEFIDFLIGKVREKGHLPEKIERIKVRKGEKDIGLNVDFLNGESITLFFRPHAPFQLFAYSK